MVALYSLDIQYRFSCRIPKVYGKGYLKSAFGGHHINEASRRWSFDFAPDFCGDLTDIDGYTTFDIGVCFGKEKRRLAKKMCDALQKTFPRITEWKEVDLLELFNA